jgi:hypothetical protein
MIAGVLLAILLLGVTDSVRAEPALQIEVEEKALTLEITGDQGDEFWLLQHSGDGETWADLLFLERDRKGSAAMAELDLSKLQAESSMIRAVQLKQDDPFYRDFLAARMRWRTSCLTNYRYEIRWNWSFFTWNGRMDVADGEVVAVETISSFPFEIGPLDERTIDGWFEEIARQRSQGAEVIDVTWHPDLGYPMSGFIDFSRLIADEEQSWTISVVTPLK